MDLSGLWLSATQQPVDGGQEGSCGLGAGLISPLEGQGTPKGLVVGQQSPRTDRHALMIREPQRACAECAFRPFVPVKLNLIGIEPGKKPGLGEPD